ncbi:MAG: DUF4159 domain-containing protein [Acidobacteriota bacterium]
MARKAHILLIALFLPLAYSHDTGGLDQSKLKPEFTFVRLIYSSAGWGRSSWATDYPKADRQFLYGLRMLSDFTFVNAQHRAMRITDPEIFSYPFLYAVEVGHMFLSDTEAALLREYLLRGGFLVVDDFHGAYEWSNFYGEIKKVFPEYEPRDLPVTHPIFHCYFNIDELVQIPGLQYLYTGSTSEKGGIRHRYMGIEDDQGRLMVMINYNVDLGDAWEWFEVEEYPREWAHGAMKLGINYIIYSMTH